MGPFDVFTTSSTAHSGVSKLRSVLRREGELRRLASCDKHPRRLSRSACSCALGYPSWRMGLEVALGPSRVASWPRAFSTPCKLAAFELRRNALAGRHSVISRRTAGAPHRLSPHTMRSVYTRMKRAYVGPPCRCVLPPRRSCFRRGTLLRVSRSCLGPRDQPSGSHLCRADPFALSCPRLPGSAPSLCWEVVLGRPGTSDEPVLFFYRAHCFGSTVSWLQYAAGRQDSSRL